LVTAAAKIRHRNTGISKAKEDVQGLSPATAVELPCADAHTVLAAPGEASAVNRDERQGALRCLAASQKKSARQPHG
jgi:hypothetical protein